MNNPAFSMNRARYALGILLGFLALNAFGGGYYGMSGAPNVPVEWLRGSPFHSYFIPGLVLIGIVGGSALLAAIAVFRRWRVARKAAIACSAIVLLWIGIQLSVIGYVSWMQPVTAAVGVAILFLASRIPEHGY